VYDATGSQFRDLDELIQNRFFAPPFFLPEGGESGAVKKLEKEKCRVICKQTASLLTFESLSTG
jgi:hypothetical protein